MSCLSGTVGCIVEHGEHALLIRQEFPQGERLVQLNTVAVAQMKSLTDNRNLTK